MITDGTFVVRDGKLALLFARWHETKRPVTITTYFVSNYPLTEQPDDSSHGGDRYGVRRLLGRTMRGVSGQVLISGYAWVPVDCSSWQVEHEESPIPAPRDGKTYTWEWSEWSGKWTKRPFDRCYGCGEYHKPGVPYCRDCGTCHQPGKGPKYSDGSRCTGPQVAA